MSARILIIEDEKPIVDILTFLLTREGYEVAACDNGTAGLHMAQQGGVDLILLDLMLPGLDGFAVCKTLRQTDSVTPVIMLTAREEESDKVMGLELGADDYITKPFANRELLARIKANLRRKARDDVAKEQLCFGDLTLHLQEYICIIGSKPVDLSQREFDLLAFLAARPGHVFSREELMEKVWNYEFFGDTRTVDVAVRRLREKIEADPAEPRYVQTKRGLGYYFGEQQA